MYFVANWFWQSKGGILAKACDHICNLERRISDLTEAVNERNTLVWVNLSVILEFICFWRFLPHVPNRQEVSSLREQLIEAQNENRKLESRLKTKQEPGVVVNLSDRERHGYHDWRERTSSQEKVSKKDQNQETDKSCLRLNRYLRWNIIDIMTSYIWIAYFNCIWKWTDVLTRRLFLYSWSESYRIYRIYRLKRTTDLLQLTLTILTEKEKEQSCCVWVLS